MSEVGASWFTGKGARLAGAAGVAALVLAAAACGAGGNSTTTATTETTAAQGSSAAQWADGVCTSFATWKTSLQGIHLGLHPSEADVKQAETQIRDATNTLRTSLKQLGKPNTAGGQAAKANLESLATVLSNDMDKIEQTLKAKPATAAAALQQISTVSATLASMAHNLTLAFGRLKQADPDGELQKAFRQSKSCSQFVS